MSFSTLGLTPSLCSSLTRLGYEIPTPIQTQAIPAALSGTDLVARAQTGTGKTAAFGLPMIQRLAASGRGAKRRSLRGLVLVPTRELALQVHRALATYGAPVQLRVTAIFGGVGMGGADAGPPARHRHRRRHAGPADRSHAAAHDRSVGDRDAHARRGRPDARHGLSAGAAPRSSPALPRTRQTLLFSATLSEDVIRLSADFTRDAARVDVSEGQVVAPTVTHRVHPVAIDRKGDLLTHVLTRQRRIRRSSSARPSAGSDRVGEHLERAGVKAAVIHGNKSQGARTRALGDFKAGRVTVLVATDIAARGLDIAQLPLVVNYDLPLVAEDYIHRVGRTGRAGRDRTRRVAGVGRRVADCCATSSGCCRRRSSRWSSRDSTSRARDRPHQSRSGEIGRSVRAADRTACMSGTERGRSIGALDATRHTRHQRHPRSERQEDDVPRRRLAPTGIHQHTPAGPSGSPLEGANMGAASGCTLTGTHPFRISDVGDKPIKDDDARMRMAMARE